MIDGSALLVFYTAVGTFQQVAWELVLVLAGSPGEAWRMLVEQTFHQAGVAMLAAWARNLAVLLSPERRP
jgi:hypothetical protein